MMQAWRKLTEIYSLSLDKRPMMTEMATSGGLWCLGDVVTQKLERQKTPIPAESNKETAGMDWKRTLHQTLYASLIWGPVAHKWYHALDWMAHTFVLRFSKPAITAATAAFSRRLVASKVALEIVLLHPVSLLAYFSIIGTLHGDSWETIVNELERDFWPTYGLELAMWTPLDVCNFAFVPVRHQLLVVNCGCLVEAIVLSYIKHNGQGTEKLRDWFSSCLKNKKNGSDDADKEKEE